MIDAAIIGLGRWGRTLVESVQGTSDLIRFTAGVARTPAKAEAFARTHGIALRDDLDAALSDAAIDAVVIATPHTGHFDQIMAAAGAGKHVYCEKPFTMTRRDTETALAALADAGRKVAVGHNRRFAPNTVELKRMVYAGELGQTIHLEGNFSANLAGYADQWRADPAESPAGGMTSLGVHVVDTFIHLFGRVAEVEARSTRLTLPFAVDDSTSALLSFEDGRTGYLATVAASAMLWHVRALGTKGWAELHGLDRFRTSMIDGGGDETIHPGYDYPGRKTIAAALEAFAADVEGGAPFPIPPEEILHGTAVFEAILRSAETGAPRRVA